jgi:hypothetical protein
MYFMRLAAIILGAGILSSLTDWLFAGDWIHRRWTYPEIWRKGPESRAIVVTSILPFVTCAAFACTAVHLGLHARGDFKLALAIWVIGPLPLVLTNAAFIKLHRVFVALYATGWLVKLLIIAAAMALFYR